MIKSTHKNFLTAVIFGATMVLLVTIIRAATTDQNISINSDQLTNLSQQDCIRTTSDNVNYIEFGPNCTGSANSEAITEGGWVNPVIGTHVGHRSGPAKDLLAFPGANDGPKGVTISSAFLEANKNADWLSAEDGVPVISNIAVEGRCLNITTALILRDSYINCPTRIQNDSWGYAGEVDDAPAINIRAENVVIEHNTITCSGYDFDICARNVRIGARDALIQFNDMSFARGAVQLFHDATVQHNYMHSFSFGLDPNRRGNLSASGRPDEITHNNAVNNQGYTNTLTKGNYIDARYGRVSKTPTARSSLTPDFRSLAYKGGVVAVGDPINGFTFTNYLGNGNGADYVVRNNYVAHSGRPFRCNSSSKVSNPQCAKDISYNAFANDKFDLFKVSPLFEDKDKKGQLGGECNYLLASSGKKTYLPTSIFGSGFTHKNTNC